MYFPNPIKSGNQICISQDWNCIKSCKPVTFFLFVQLDNKSLWPFSFSFYSFPNIPLLKTPEEHLPKKAPSGLMERCSVAWGRRVHLRRIFICLFLGAMRVFPRRRISRADRKEEEEEGLLLLLPSAIQCTPKEEGLSLLLPFFFFLHLPFLLLAFALRQSPPFPPSSFAAADR